MTVEAAATVGQPRRLRAEPRSAAGRGRRAAGRRAERLLSIRDGGRVYDSFGWVHPGLAPARPRPGDAPLGRGSPASTGGRRGARGARPAGALGSWSSRRRPATSPCSSRDGYAPVRWFFEMLRPTSTTCPTLPLPDGLELRPVPKTGRGCLLADSEAFQDHWGARDIPRPTSGGSSATPRPTCRCGRSPGRATRSPARSCR